MVGSNHNGIFDWVIELGVVIGSTARGVAVNLALDHVASFCLANDVSECVDRLNFVNIVRIKASIRIFRLNSGFLPLVSPRILLGESKRQSLIFDALRDDPDSDRHAPYFPKQSWISYRNEAARNKHLPVLTKHL